MSLEAGLVRVRGAAQRLAARHRGQGRGRGAGGPGVVMMSVIIVIMMRMCAPGEAGLGLVDGYAVGGLLGGGEGGAQPAQRALTPA